jgi:23S rRNA pseudouridine1911/1915/1917 synthase
VNETPPKPVANSSQGTLDVLAGPDCNGKRLDAVLAGIFPGNSRSKLSQEIKDGLVLVDGIQARPSVRVRTGQSISYKPHDLNNVNKVNSSEIPLNIIYEDAFLIAVDKQPGLSVHPGARPEEPTLVDAILVRNPEISIIGQQDRPGIVHRLDKNTSGVIVIAKTMESLECLKAAFALRHARKRYLAFVKGLPPRTGLIQSPIARHPVLRHKMSASQLHGKHSVTTWRVLKRFPKTGIALLSIRLFTGRTHQARVHLASIGYPVLGDVLYGNSQTIMLKEFPLLEPLLSRHLLHARRLSVQHPDGRRISFSAPWPEDFLKLYLLLDMFEND